MNKENFLTIMEQELKELVPAQERAEMLRYYREYFEEAGPEGEQAVIESLGDPRVLAQKLAAEAGYKNVRRKPSRMGIGAVAVIVACLCLVALIIALVGTMFAKLSFETPESRNSAGRLSSGEQIRVYDETFSSVDIDVPMLDVTISEGSGYHMEMEWYSAKEEYDLYYKLDEDVLIIGCEQEQKNSSKDDYAILKITVPENCTLEEIDIQLGLGDVALEGFMASELDCSTGMGNIDLKKVVLPDISCSTGMGDVTLTDTEAEEIQCSTGMGDIKISSKEDLSDWKVDLSTGMGDVKVNGKDKKKDFYQSGTAGKLEASTGMGDVRLTYEP